jgi:hypothetical protein
MFVPLLALAEIKAFNCRRASIAPSRYRLDAIRDRSKVPALARRPPAPGPRRRARARRPQGRRRDTSPTHASPDASTPSSQRPRCCRLRHEPTCLRTLRHSPSRSRQVPLVQIPTLPPMWRTIFASFPSNLDSSCTCSSIHYRSTLRCTRAIRSSPAAIGATVVNLLPVRPSARQSAGYLLYNPPLVADRLAARAYWREVAAACPA